MTGFRVGVVCSWLPPELLPLISELLRCAQQDSSRVGVVAIGSP